MSKFVYLVLGVVLCIGMMACAGREVDVQAKGQIIVGGGVGGSL